MKTLEISDETFEKIKDQLQEDEKIDFKSLEDFVGKNFFFRTVTYHLIGKVTKKIGTFFILENASWVADSGRFMEAIKDGQLNEVEPIGDWMVNIMTIVDGGVWRHKLPKTQK